MLISVTFGNENFQNSSAKYQMFACRSSEHVDIEPAQKHLWMAAKDGNAIIRRHGGINKVPAAPGYKEELGKWSTCQYDVPEGLVIKLYGMRKLPEMVSGRHMTASMFLQSREEAALIRVTALLTGDGRAGQSEISMFEGRADLITLQDARDLGVSIQAHHASQFEDYNQDTLFRIEMLSEMISARPTVQANVVQNTQGESVRVVTPRRTRAIQV